MQFYMPVKLFEEKDCVRNHASELAEMGDRAFIVTGGHSSKKNGSLDDVCEALESRGRKYFIFDEIEENPSVETVMKAQNAGNEAGADFVIGVGGGSAMDAAKAIAVMLKHPDADASYLYDASRDHSALPVAEVPTTCGTGSEVTAIAVLTRHKFRTKKSISHHVFARYAFVDGRYLATAPRSVLANTATDALAHLWESGINSGATPYSMMLVHAGLKQWSANKDVLEGLKKPEYSDYASLMRASVFAGMAIAQTGTAIPHGLSYTLTYELGMEHGKACGYFEAGYLAEAPEDLRNEMLELTGFSSIREWQEFYRKICDPQEVSDDILELALDTVASNPEKLKPAPFHADRETLRKIVFYR